VALTAPRRDRREMICLSPGLYRTRNLVEHFFNKIKLFGVLGSLRQVAFIQISSNSLWLRVNESAPHPGLRYWLGWRIPFTQF